MTERAVCSGRFAGFMFVVSVVGLFLICVIWKLRTILSIQDVLLLDRLLSAARGSSA